MNPSLLSPLDSIPVELIAQALRHPPSAPKVLPLLKRHLLNVNASLHHIVDLIRLDPGIAARVLQVANSAVHARGVRCHSVEMAVHRIGFDHIYEITANAVAEQVLVRPLTAYAIDADDFWRASVSCGLAAERLAEECGEDRHVAYTLGLLHGVGMVAIDQWVQRHAPKMGFFGRGFPREHSDGERALLGCTNAEVGAEVLRAWEFPPEMSEPLRWQYAPFGSTAYRRLNCLLHVAKWVRSRVCAEAGDAVPSLDVRFLTPIKLTMSGLERQVALVRTRMDDVQRSLTEVPGEAA